MKLQHILFLLFCLSGRAYTQSDYSKVKINLIGKDISTLAKAGIEVDHGYFAPGKCLINDFSKEEIAKIRSLGYEMEVLIDDVVSYYSDPNRANQQLALSSGVALCDQNELELYQTPLNYHYGSMGGYLTWDELLVELDSMAMLYPDLVTVKTPIGIQSLEGREIYWLRISDNATVDEDEPEVLYTALHHAREPNSLSQMIFYMWYLLENYAEDPEIKQLVDATEMYFIPCINPDGYVFNQKNQPDGGGLWRKNKRLIGPQLFGVDLNRNYGYLWGLDDEGSSAHPGDQTYRGVSEFSEPETQAVKEFCEAHAFKIALNYHTYGNLLIHPWGYNDQPTEDNEIFKTIGREMTKENDYLLGTGKETVGYIVNGDSDDWMYGEELSKSKIFSMTPEVGNAQDGFWPARDRIDILNKSALHQNLVAAQALHPWLTIEEKIKSEFIFDRDGTIVWDLSNFGLEDGDFTVKFYTEPSNVLLLVKEESFRLNSMQQREISMPFYIDDPIVSGSEVDFIVEVNSGEFSYRSRFRKTLALGERVEVLNDRIKNLDNFLVTTSWGISDQIYLSLPGSLADSPEGDYAPNARAIVTLNTPIDLSDAIQAHVRFDALWQIEKDYDYAQILASSDGLNFSPLCGFFTKPGSADQALDEPLYDGVSLGWVQESMSLEDYLGEKEVFLRFVFMSDQAVELRGIYIDNLLIEKITGRVTATEDVNSLSGLRISPNPVDNQLLIETENTAVECVLYDLTGKPLIRQSIAKDQTLIETGMLSSGVYMLRIYLKNGGIVTKKLIKI